MLQSGSWTWKALESEDALPVICATLIEKLCGSVLRGYLEVFETLTKKTIFLH
jgi:hypothetical protein